MKRVVGGITFNTDTATRVADVLFNDEKSGTVTHAALYQTPLGVFFALDAITTSYRGPNLQLQKRTIYEWHDVGNSSQARAWAERYGMTIIHDLDDISFKSHRADKFTSLYIRLPPSLKVAVEEKARATGLSVNTFVMRCVEDLLASTAA